MKKSYLAFLCLLGAWGASAQTVNVKPIGELQTTPALSTEFHKVENPIKGTSENRLNSSKSLVTGQFVPKSGCTDTLDYTYFKQAVNDENEFYYYNLLANSSFGYRSNSRNILRYNRFNS